jgi:two-component system cell cycle sensor histidine kinase PleC
MVGEIPSTDVERQVDDQLVRIAVGTRIQYADGVPFAVLIAIALSGVFPSLGVGNSALAALWVTGEIIFAIVGVREWQRYQTRTDTISAGEQRDRLTILWTFHGLVWGSVVPVFWDAANPANQAILCTIILGVMVGSFFMLSPVRAVFAANLLSVVALAEITFLIKGGALGDTLGIILPLFTAMILRYGWTLSAKYEQAVRLHLRNEQMTISLNAAVARAENASRAKSQFLANMSHELRTPLNAILGFSEMIASRTMLKNIEKHFEYAEHIHRSAHHFLNLINDILDLAKIEAGSFLLRETEVDLTALIRDSLSIMEPKAREGGCALECEIAVDLPRVTADERAIKQVLLNLLSNALKFTPSGGTVTAFVLHASDGGVDFGVRDTGVGIAQGDQARVFENFGQGRHDVVTAEKGTGLGLPIVKGLIEEHGGTVSLTSQVGHGTTVLLHLPPERSVTPLQRAS